MTLTAGRWDAERLVGVGLMVGVGVLCVVGLAVGSYASVGLLASPPPIPSAFVKVTTDRGNGSATHIGDGLYVTAAHVVVAGAKINNVAVEVLWSNTEYDIALLRGTDQLAFVPLVCAPLQVGDTGHAHGNPLGFDDITTTLTVAGVARPMGPWKLAVPMDGTIAPGMSGGAWISGGLAGVNVGILTTPVGEANSLTGFAVVVPASVICGLMGRS